MPPHSRRGTRRGGDAHVPQGWENGAPREKGGQVGSQSVDKSLPLSAVLISLQHTEITAKIIQSQGTQPTDPGGYKPYPAYGRPARSLRAGRLIDISDENARRTARGAVSSVTILTFARRAEMMS